MTDHITVYWSPATFQSWLFAQGAERHVDWAILYSEPNSLYNEISAKRNNNKADVLRCPAFINKTKNTFILKNPMETELFIQDNSVQIVSNNYINSVIEREPMLKNNLIFTYKLNWVFFTDEPSLNMSLTSPWFSNSKYLNQGSLMPGIFDIGKWFRVLNLEFNLWENNNQIRFQENEDLAYVEFQTDKQVKLQQFNMTSELDRLLETVSNSTVWEKNVSLVKRYKRFQESKFKPRILKEIQKNLL